MILNGALRERIHMFQKVDCIRIQVSDIQSALDFYENKLGLELVWRKGSSGAGPKLQNSDTELVLVTNDGFGILRFDFLVESVDKSAEEFEEKGGRIVVDPFNIKIGKCAVFRDPWKNKYVILDLSKGHLKTDSDKNVIS
jgi:predicted enzyme related to lactoylglutathione lyase